LSESHNGETRRILSNVDKALLIKNFLLTLNEISGDSRDIKVPLTNIYDKMSLGAFNLPLVMPIILDDYLLLYGLVEQDSDRVLITDYGRKILERISKPETSLSDVIKLIEPKEAPMPRKHVVQLDETVPVSGTEKRTTTITSEVEIDHLKSLLPHVINTDKPTLSDTLGYQMYAYAIAKFLTDRGTTAPISISIQAPWGGGKTSLMRMVRSMLDKSAPELPGDKNKKKEKGQEEEKEQKRDNKKKGQEGQGQESQEDVTSLKDIKKKLKISAKRYKKNNKTHPEPEKPVPARDDIEPRITVWFNAWKYESTEQVWAGLADGIVKGIADRMERLEREWFYLRLNLRRRDPESIRRWISDRTLKYLWQKILPWILISIIGIGGSTMAAIIGWTRFGGDPHISTASLFGAGIFAGLGFFQAINKKISMEKEPAEISLGEFIKVPNYSEKLGFVHHVVRDLELVFETLPTEFKDKPIVIFIDDLDRCSPTKVAQVIEGINLFLAGEFQGCIFVIGMDAEMVAAALEVAHYEVISKLPNYSTQMPIGWRFMDKFIQLPIIIPPSLEENVRKYINYLLPQASQIETETVNQQKNTGLLEQGSLTFSVEQEKILDEMSEKIETISDTDKMFLDKIKEAAFHFSNNPREIKRFMNVLRFQRFIMTSVAGTDTATLFDQVSRWIILSLKWPQAVRWLYWSPTSISIKERLETLEGFALNSNNNDEWKNKVKSLLQIAADDKTSLWIHDENLRVFFEHEATKYNQAPLSAGAGRGIY
jgi:hypothetical protein